MRKRNITSSVFSTVTEYCFRSAPTCRHDRKFVHMCTNQTLKVTPNTTTLTNHMLH